MVLSDHHRVGRLSCAGLLVIGAAGCDLIVPCAPQPQDVPTACGVDQPICEGGSAEPVADPRDDGAVDITQFSADQIPAGVLLQVPNEGGLHVLTSDPLPYVVNPPASGPHFFATASTGLYCDALSPGYWVHSLEHGYIVVLFDQNETDKRGWRPLFQLLMLATPPSPLFGNRKLVVLPYDGLAHPLCLIAWNRQLYLDQFDLPVILDFYARYLDQGPELEA